MKVLRCSSRKHCLPRLYLKEFKKYSPGPQQKWYCQEKVKDLIKENLIAQFSKETEPHLSILITVECSMAGSKEGKMNKKKLWKGKSWYSWRKVSQETGMPPGLPVSFIVCQSPAVSLLWVPHTKALFGFYPRPWPVNHKVPYFPWKWENFQLLDTTGRIIWGSTWGLRYL